MNIYNDFYSYSGGIYSHTTGAFEGSHFVLIIGYDDTNQYFIAKNSWGTYWGESGFFKIAYSELSSVVQFGYWTIAYGDAVNPSPLNYPLSVNLAGTGKGTVSAPGLLCSGNTCTGSYIYGEIAALEAMPDAGSLFQSCIGCRNVSSNALFVTMDSLKNVTVTFGNTTEPTVTSFTIPATSNSLTIVVSSFTATDNVAVTGYLITETSTLPLATDTAWSATAPASYTFATAGAKTLYAWAKDAVGYVSTAKSATISVDTTAPTGSININGGSTYTKITSVTLGLSATDTGSGVVTQMQFSADGTTWTTPESYVQSKNWTLATGDGAKTVSVKFMDKAGNWSSVYNATITLDTTPPDTTITAKPNNPSNNSSPSFAFTSTEANSTFDCRLDGGAFAACTSPNSYSGLTAGNHTFEVRATDPAGNTDATPATYDWTIDLAPPDATIVSKPANPTNQKSASFTFSSSDTTATFECRLDTAAFAACTSPYTYPNLADGSHTFIVQAKDPAGNVTATQPSFTWTINTEPPTIVISSPVAGFTSNKTPKLSYTLSDGTASVTLDGSPISVANGADLPTLSEGEHNVTIQAIDALGNNGNASVIFTVDTAGPAIHISTLTDGGVTGNPVLNLAGTITDVFGIKVLTVNNGIVTLNPDSSYNYAVPLVTGSNAINITAVDINGNQTSVSTNIIYDATAPQLTVTEPADGALIATNTATVSGTIGDVVNTVDVKVNESKQSAVISGSNYSTIVTLASGMNTIEVIAADVAQNTNSIKRTVFFDVTKPGMAITPPVEDLLVTSNCVDISGVVDPAPLDATLRISTDGATFTSPTTVTGAGTNHITFDHHLTFTSEGYYPVTVQVRDSADNLLGATQRNFIYSRGTIFINKGALFTITTAVTLDLGYTGAVSMQFSTNGGTTWTPWEKFKAVRKFTLPAGDGIKTVYVRFKDGSPASSSDYSATIILDTKAPRGTISINDGAYATNDANVTLSLSVADVNGVAEMQFSDNNRWSGVPWETFAPTRAYTIPATTGTHTVYARFKDAAGKVSAVCSASIVYTLMLPVATAGAVTINGGAEFTTTTAAKLTITTPSHDPAFSLMRFSTNGAAWTAWETVKPAKSLTLPAGDGVKTVYVKFRGKGVADSAAYMNTIILDTRPPVGAISINGGVATTTDPQVTLSLSAADANGVTDMQFSANNRWTGVPWEPFAPTKSFDLLTSIPGNKSVYARFKDAAGNISATCSDSIKLVAP